MKNIYKTIAQTITSFFVRNKIIDNKSKDIYSYGFEILLSTVTYSIIFIFVSFITNTLLPSLFFWIGFYIVRTISGGYHAKTYLQCHLLFESTHLLYIIFIKLLPNSLRSNASTIFFIISAILILAFSPVDHPNKPFTKNEKKRFRIISCIHALSILIIYTVFVSINQNIISNNSLSFAMGTFIAAISLMIVKLKQGGK